MLLQNWISASRLSPVALSSHKTHVSSSAAHQSPVSSVYIQVDMRPSASDLESLCRYASVSPTYVPKPSINPNPLRHPTQIQVHSGLKLYTIKADWCFTVAFRNDCMPHARRPTGQVDLAASRTRYAPLK